MNTFIRQIGRIDLKNNESEWKRKQQRKSDTKSYEQLK